MKLFLLGLVCLAGLFAEERVLPGTLKSRDLTASQVYLLSGAAADLASSVYVTRKLESRGYVAYERNFLYGRRFDAADVALGLGLVAGVFLIERAVPNWPHWNTVNWFLGTVRFGAAGYNLLLLQGNWSETESMLNER